MVSGPLSLKMIADDEEIDAITALRSPCPDRGSAESGACDAW